MKRSIIILIFFIPVSLFSQVPFSTSPSWVSTSFSDFSTGAAWTDINRDGWQDLVISNGNDMDRQRLVVYLNSGTGTLPLMPSWQAADIDYHGHLSAGDINADGFPDVAVSVYIGPSGFNSKGRLKVYMNLNGTLSSNPSWVSLDSFYTFSCALGDADNDGDLDLAAACGESYNNRANKNRIYYNNNGVLSQTPGWMSRDSAYGMDAGWADFNGDGRLDLVIAGERGPNRMYLNYGDSIATVPTWTSTDPSLYSNSLFTEDVNNDGFIDLAVSDNNQLGGSGKFKIYLNNNGTLNGTPFWQSAFAGYGSGITLVDFDFDNDADLVTGGWWNPLRIYLNQNGNFPVNPNWTSSTNSVVEAIVFSDYNNNGLDTITFQFTGNSTRKLFYLNRKPVQKILNIRFGTDTLELNEYCMDPENGWIVFKNAPASGTTVYVKAVLSHNLDFAVSNWDPNIGNYVYNNTLVIGIDPVSSGLPVSMKLYQNYPNPFNPSTSIGFELPSSSGREKVHVELTVYDVSGRLVSTLVSGEMLPGYYNILFDGGPYSSGVYIYRIIAGGKSLAEKMLLLK